MIVSRIRLSWFRGAAELAELETRGRSVVVFGENGAGKSCFVDSVEYALRDGRIEHLAHEYSGRHQEKAVLNTHRPGDTDAFLEIELGDGSLLRREIAGSGASKREVQGDTAFDALGGVKDERYVQLDARVLLAIASFEDGTRFLPKRSQVEERRTQEMFARVVGARKVIRGPSKSGD